MRRKLATVGWGLAFVGRAAEGKVTIVPDTSRSIHVTGRATVSAKPDTATVELGVFADDASPKKAKAVVDQAIGRIVSLARDLAIADTNIRTGAIKMERGYTDERESKLLGYQATRTVTVVLREIEKLDSLLGGAVAAGANRNFDVQLSSSKPEELWQKALEAAVDALRAQAESIVERLGAPLRLVRTISLETAPAPVLYSGAGVAPNSAKFLPRALK